MEEWARNEEVALDHLNRFAKFEIEYVEDALPPDRPVKILVELREKVLLSWHGMLRIVTSIPCKNLLQPMRQM